MSHVIKFSAQFLTEDEATRFFIVFCFTEKYTVYCDTAFNPAGD
jgi:hypothetical protein